MYKHTQLLVVQEKYSSVSSDSDSHKYMFTRNAQVSSHSKKVLRRVSFFNAGFFYLIASWSFNLMLYSSKRRKPMVCLLNFLPQETDIRPCNVFTWGNTPTCDFIKSPHIHFHSVTENWITKDPNLATEKHAHLKFPLFVYDYIILNLYRYQN